jgi:hypothetical protein
VARPVSCLFTLSRPRSTSSSAGSAGSPVDGTRDRTLSLPRTASALTTREKELYHACLDYPKLDSPSDAHEPLFPPYCSHLGRWTSSSFASPAVRPCIWNIMEQMWAVSAGGGIVMLACLRSILDRRDGSMDRDEEIHCFFLRRSILRYCTYLHGRPSAVPFSSVPCSEPLEPSLIAGGRPGRCGSSSSREASMESKGRWVTSASKSSACSASWACLVSLPWSRL